MDNILLQLLIPEEWKDLLSKVQKIFPSAYIAGGGLRDIDYELKPKDLDIFIPSTDKTRFSLLDGLNKDIKGLETTYHLNIKEPEPIPEHYIERNLKDNNVENGWELDFVKDYNRNNRTLRKLAKSKLRNLKKQKRKIYHLRRGTLEKLPVDFIFGCNNTCDIDQFDFSICQIMFDGIKIIKSREYQETESTGFVKITNKSTFKQERLDKFKQKFDWMEFEEFE